MPLSELAQSPKGEKCFGKKTHLANAQYVLGKHIGIKCLKGFAIQLKRVKQNQLD